MTNDAHFLAAEKASEILQSKGFDAYIVGGAVRDLLLGHPPKDYDLVTNATPEDLLKIDEFTDPKHTDPAQAFGVTRTKIQIGPEIIPIEITTYRKDIEAHLGRALTQVEFADLPDDVKRRDFTINALALDPLNHTLIDLVDGLSDLSAKRIKFIGKPTARIKEDSLRVLRGIRFKNRFGFHYEHETFVAITSAIKNGVLSDIATDRLRNELTNMLTYKTRTEALQDLDILGVIREILPELYKTKGVPQPDEYHSEGDVYTHSALAIGYLPKVVSARLAWATLLHDIGKAPTYQPAEITGDRIRFNQHHSEGADLTRQVLKRLNFSRKLTDEIVWMVHYHMAIAYLPEMRPGHAETFMLHDAFEDLLELHRADAHAAWTREDGKTDTNAPDLSEIEKMYEEFKNQPKSKSLKDDLSIDGHWVLQHFPQIKKGEELGIILNELRLLHSERKLVNKDQVTDEIKKLLSKTQQS